MGCSWLHNIVTYNSLLLEVCLYLKDEYRLTSDKLTLNDENTNGTASTTCKIHFAYAIKASSIKKCKTLKQNKKHCLDVYAVHVTISKIQI